MHRLHENPILKHCLTSLVLNSISSSSGSPQYEQLIVMNQTVPLLGISIWALWPQYNLSAYSGSTFSQIEGLHKPEKIELKVGFF